ncbi:hypothetical protein V6Z11_A07G032300 [Gossypium hirsutum]
MEGLLQAGSSYIYYKAEIIKRMGVLNTKQNGAVGGDGDSCILNY